jgi:DNA-binding NtrC family response regulator
LPNSLLYLCCPPAERRATESLLGEAGVSPHWVDDAQAALASLASHQGVVIADFGDPHAAAIVSEIRQARPETLVLAVADPSRPGALAEIERAGIPAVLHRPLIPGLVSLLLGAVPGDGDRHHTPAASEGTPIVARSVAMRRALEAVEHAAASSAGVLMCGERGSGRAMLAREIHDRSAGAEARFVRVDCVEGTGDNLEAVLFGTTSAGRDAQTRGRVERVSPGSAVAAAQGGTLFLAHLAEAPQRTQARLVRLLRDGEVAVGNIPGTVPLRVRPIASAMPDWDAAVADGHVREDLARRIAVGRVNVPSLRDRRADLPLLAACLLDKACRSQHVGLKSIDSPALALLAALPWRGNGPEFEAVLSVLARLAPGPTIEIEHVLASISLDAAGQRLAPSGTLREARKMFELQYIESVLEQHHGRVPDAARALGIQRSNLYRKIRLLKSAAPQHLSSGPKQAL